MRIIHAVIYLAVFVLGLVFAAVNTDPVRLNYYLGYVELPLSAVLVVTLAIGIGLGLIVNLAAVLGLKRETRRLRRSNSRNEQELMRLRALPARDDG